MCLSQDLFEPVPKRTRKHLNVLINLIKFLEHKKPMLVELSEEKHAQRDSVKELRIDEQEAAAELVEMQAEHAAQEQVRLATRYRAARVLAPLLRPCNCIAHRQNHACSTACASSLACLAAGH